MDIKKRIQELSLDQKAKLYFMGLVRQGKIDRLPEDPKAAYMDMLYKDLANVGKENLKEITDYDFKGSEVISRVNRKQPDLFGKQLFADIFPKGSASELKAIEALKAHDDSGVKQRMDRFAPMFVHIQYHEFEHEGEKYRLHQTQYYNSNFEDKDPNFNPKVTLLNLMKLDPDTKDSEDIGLMLVKTDEYVKDLEVLKSRGVLGKRVMEGDTYEKMAAKGKKAGNLKQGTVRKRLRIKNGEKIPLARINKAISSLKKRKSLSDKDKKYLKALNLAKTLKTTTNVKEIATELGYLNEAEYNTPQTVKVKDITFDMVRDIFKDEYKGEPSDRPKPDSDETVPSYKYYDSVSFTNGDSSSTYITDEVILDDWKKRTLRNVGNVDVILDPTADVWFNKVRIEDPKFKEREKNIGKGIASYYASKKSGDFTGD